METGIDVDIETGRPPFHLSHENFIAQQKAKEEKRQARTISRYQDLVNDLAGDGGAIVKQIAGLYANRINELIKKDSACMAYQAIFDNIGIKINLGKSITVAKIKEIEELTSKDI